VDQPERKTVGHRRRSAAEIAELVTEYQTSGMSRLEFCQKHVLSPATLARYRKRQQVVQAEEPQVGRWVRVEVAGSQPISPRALAVVLSSGRRIEVGYGFDAPTLARLVELLERR
jgi:hypothetical protein